ncbi:LysE family translocator [Bacillus sp. AFS017336]|uniref:LysE family translocator n=1 Tax=Bacillus sp. AFS017336 TaxID=2033489 RepID=UPI000BF01456|nr:LysE family translocator [Bacillus sp. AFS017336]PEL14386.1 lysine transporter LysE [Bacillus sp. AFS017336]
MISFILVVLTLFLIPGPAVLLTLSQTMKGGKWNGILTGLGIAVGDLIHTCASVFGLSAILMTSAFAFEVVKYLGAAYLFYLGITALIRKTKKSEKAKVQKEVNTKLSFRQAILIEVLNPKTALFFLALLPQFVQHNDHSVFIQLLTLGITFVILSILYTTSLVLLSSLIGNKFFNKNSNSSKWMGKTIGLVYIGLGVRVALQTQE